MAHDQHATHDGATAALARIRARIVPGANGTSRSRPAQRCMRRRHGCRRLHIVMRIWMRMRHIVIAGINVTGRHHANAAGAACAHAYSHTALQAAQRSVGAAMVTVTVMAAMGATAATVQRDAPGQRIIGRLYGTDHRAAAHDVRQLIGLDIKVLRLSHPKRGTNVNVVTPDSCERAVHDS